MDGLFMLIVTWTIIGLFCYAFIANRRPCEMNEKIHDNITATALPDERSNSTSLNSQTSYCWPNLILAWLYQHYNKVPESLDAWIKSLNEAAKKISSPATCEISFEGFGDQSNALNPPKVSDIVIESGPKNHLTLKCTIDIAEINLRIFCCDNSFEEVVMSRYDAKILDLHGQIEARIACIANQIYLMGCFKGRPELDIQLSNISGYSSERINCGLVEDTIRRCLVTAVTNVAITSPSSLPTSFLNSPLVNSSYRVHSPVVPNARHEIPADIQRTNLPAQQTIMEHDSSASNSPNALRITLIQAQSLGKNHAEFHKDAAQPYIIVEIDDPNQKHTTVKGYGENPYWGQSFIFDLANTSEEILFEIYDDAVSSQGDDEHRFLGLALVSLHDILRTRQSTHDLKLEGRPYKNEKVSGALTVQFHFSNDEDLAIGQVNFANQEKITAATEYVAYDPRDSFSKNDETLGTDLSRLKRCSVEIKLKNGSDTDQIPLSRNNQEKQLYTRHAVMNKSTDDDHITDHRRTDDQYYDTSDGNTVNVTNADYSRKSRGRMKIEKKNESKRDTSFFSEIKQRLSGSHRKRTKSFDVECEKAVSTPPSREHSKSRPIQKAQSETRSYGGKSKESAKSLYQHSTLVLETQRNGKKMYYQIPPAVYLDPDLTKILSTGKKLHIHNEHTFEATKVDGGTLCDVCHRRIARSFTKQSYKCRDCHLKCHKYCHFQTDDFCKRSTLNNVEIHKNIDWNKFISKIQFQEYISMDGV